MSNDNIITFQPSESFAFFNDALTELVHKGVRQIMLKLSKRNWLSF